MKYNLTIIATALLLSTLLTASSCKKDKSPATEEQLPPETQTGAFTIGFKVDGVIYKHQGKGGLLSDGHLYYVYTSSDSIFFISGSSIIDKKFNFTMNFKCFVLNTNCLLTIPANQATFYDNSNGTIPGGSNTYTTNTMNTGNVMIKYFNGTFYPGNFGTIVSGVFAFNAVNGDGKVIHITEGRFDIGR
ncbi:MAG: hypothetical protein ABL929_07315 [Ferruginibacter sp.]